MSYGMNDATQVHTLLLTPIDPRAVDSIERIETQRLERVSRAGRGH